MAVGGMPGPSPAGHQAELNYIYGMVEELSKQLADNRRVTEDIVSGLGRVRTRARSQGQSNDELLASAADDINVQQENLDSLISLLSESLEKAKYSRDANAALLAHYAHALTLMLKQFHDYKTKHVADVTSWHRSYRAQLDDARRENSRLREQIWEMQSHASEANDQLRKFRRKYDEDEERWKKRVDDKAMRQELRFWKRMAMPELEEDDSYWSDDDDVVDPAEKMRLAEMERRVLQEQGGESPGEDEGDDQQLVQEQFGALSLMGGVSMQRNESQQSQLQQQQQGMQPLGQAMPMPPPRPGSAASSTGSTGP
ncbi:hypothetical protein CC79DRAFT_1336025 [Sarocladium strictum]